MDVENIYAVESDLSKGQLTEEQKARREEQGYKRDKPGKVDDEEDVDITTGKVVDDSAVAGGGGGGDDEAEAGEGAADADAASVAATEATTKKAAKKKPVDLGQGVPAEEARSQFHGKALRDYQGRSWVEPPKGTREGDLDHACYIPKKCLHTYSGHTKGVQSIQFFPKYGHLLLSGSMDGKVKIWDVATNRKVQRTYTGHSGAVRQVAFSNEGDTFLSASFDKHVKMWDTETGQCKGTFTNGRIPYCVAYYPVDNNIFLAGCADKKVVQYDARTGAVVQEYDHHLSAVNTITFYDEGRRFVSSSDDKKLLCWEYDIPAPIKYVSDPGMHSIPAMTAHPSGKYIAGQSMDNAIVMFEAGDKFFQVRKKTFKGHNTAGYACQVGFSPNGRFVMSGDGTGQLWFWDWKSKKNYKKLRAHTNGPCIGAIWHPSEPSMVATCGWDGLIKLWD